jgi:hypothetical protein
MSSILFKSEDAIKTLLINSPNLSGLGIHIGSENNSLTLPYIAILAERSEERQPRGKGNYSVFCKIELYTSIDDLDRNERIALANTLIELLSQDTLVSDLNPVIDFTLFGFLKGQHSQKVSDRSHIYTIELELICANSDL